jgi:hypothetical protein
MRVDDSADGGPATVLGLPRRLALGGLVLGAVMLGAATLPAVSRAAACDPPVTNPIACENTKPGADPSTWEIDGAGDPSIQGYATQMSVNKGDPISFKIKSQTSNYHIDVLRLGYYGGDGARLIASNLTPTGSSTQPSCAQDSSSGLVDCGGWSVSRTWTVPSTAVSGIYIAHLVRNDTGGESHIAFVVRDDASTAPILLQTSDATWQAYNAYGGNSLYKCTVACPAGDPLTYKAAYKVSYNRPMNSAEDDNGRSWIFSGAEYPMIRFLEANGYDMSYFSQVDTETRPSLIRNHKLFISSGHDEYWSQNQRSNVEAARDAGVNLAFFSGNEMFWKTRYESSDRTLVSYKDTHFDQQQDPVAWTGTWRDPRLTTPPDRPVPENALTGQSFLVNAGTSSITVPAAFKNLRLWRNTDVASLQSGSVTLAPSTLGYEWDQDADNGFRPAGQIRLSSTTVSDTEVFTDYGSSVATGQTATHNMTAYRAPSGALVFGAGTVQWAWGLDNYVTWDQPVDRNMRQATVNLLADMAAQPSTLLPGLVPASKSTDATKPTSTITSPAAGASLTDGTSVTITGTATDGGGGAVAGVEISTDGGGTWHPATSGTSSWNYTWIVHGHPTTTIKTRATDDSANTEVPGAGRTVNVNCPCSIWGDAVSPPSADSGDPTATEVGVKFRSDIFGQITAVRFYKSSANSGQHTGSLWKTDGTRLAQAAFTSETASGWQTATFSTPVQVQPNTTYIASYHAPKGHFAATPAYLYPQPAPGPNGGSSADAAPLHALRNDTSTLNGVYAYSPTSTFPGSSFGASNYWVDVRFQAIPPPGAATSVKATSGGVSSANISWTAPTTGGAVTTYTITPRVNGVSKTPKVIDAPATAATVTGLTAGTTYSFYVTASNPAGSGPEAPGSGSSGDNVATPGQPVVPAVTTNVSAVPASQSALVSWTAPASDGDSPLTGYTITPYVGSTAQPPITVGAAATSSTVGGLTNGTAHTFTVAATNAIGSGPASSPSSAVKPQATIFDLATPATPDTGDATAVELGVKFSSDVDGKVTGVRYYKSAANIGIHIGSLWSTTGTRLAQALFANETTSGWQTAEFSTPVTVTAGTTYIASYYAPNGHYSAQGAGLAAAVVNAPLRAPANATTPNGVYMYAPTSSFPANSFNASNYYVDALFAVPIPGQVTNVTAVEAGRTSATVSFTPPASGGAPSSYLVTPLVNGVAQPATTVPATAQSTTVGGLTTGTTYTFTVTAKNANGKGPASAPSNQVTPQAAVAPSAPTNVDARAATSAARVTWDVPSGDGDSPITGYKVIPFVGATAQAPVTVGASSTATTVTGLTNGTTYTFSVVATNAVGDSAGSARSVPVTPRFTIFDFATPSVADSGDGNPVELGVKFTAGADGFVTGVRFYKSALNTGSHTAGLWTTGGSLLAQAPFTSETASGWQTVTFPTPVAITAGTVYVASYHAPNGHYSVSGGALSTSVSNGPLTALADSTTPNGVYSYGVASALPTGSFNATNYWVDPMFAHAPPPSAPTNVTATAGQASATVSWTAPSTGGAPTSYTVTPLSGGVAQTPKTIAGTPPSTSTTVNNLTAGTTYTFTVTASNAGGPGPPSTPSSVAATPDAKSAIVSWAVPASDGGSAITGYSVTPFIGFAAQATTSAGASATSVRVPNLTVGTSYTFRVSATNGVGGSPSSASSNAAVPKSSIFEFGTPAVIDGGDSNSVNIGVKFASDVNGSIAGLRFYKSSTNTGTHVGALWTADGTLLRQATFTAESASGWQQVSFATPVAVTANTTYVASYLAPNGHYALTGGAFGPASADNPPLHALANSIATNGVYGYGTVSAFPTNSFNATNYWVDVLFDQGP